LKSPVTGDKQALYAGGSLYRALSHSGLSHMVAVSGMHVSFLVGLILLICSPRQAFIPGIPAVLLFMLMTGMTPSVVRAGILYLALLTAPLVKRESDGLTTLLLALALILLQNPAAVCRVGCSCPFLHGGILLQPSHVRGMTGYIRKKLKTAPGRMGAPRPPPPPVLTAEGIVPLVALHFGYFPVYPCRPISDQRSSPGHLYGLYFLPSGGGVPVWDGAAWLTAWAAVIQAAPGSSRAAAAC
jgi:predicted membrane metal-binding protein